MDNASKMKCLSNENQLREDQNKSKLETEQADLEIQDIRKKLLNTMSGFLNRRDLRDLSPDFMRRLLQQEEILAKIKANKKHNKSCTERGYPKMKPCGD